MRVVHFSALVGILAASPATAQAGDDIVFHSNEAYKAAGYPFSQAVEAGGWVFLSGEIGTVPGTTGLIDGGIEAETRQTMDNIRASLTALDLDMSHVVKCTAMLADMVEWPAFNAVYKTYFERNYPARSAFGTTGLALGARVEVECIARR